MTQGQRHEALRLTPTPEMTLGLDRDGARAGESPGARALFNIT